MVSKNELVSIIVPVYNVEDYLDECVESLVNQTYKNIEIILINDGSTDNSALTCEEWEKKDSRVRFISKRNEGQGPTRNLGVQEAKGEWIAFVDSDDWVDTRYVESLYHTAKTENAELVICRYCRVDYITGIREVLGSNSSCGIPFSKEQKLIYMKDQMWTQLCKKKIFTKYNIKQPDYRSEDYAVKLLICILANKMVMIDDVLYFYRKNRPGATTQCKDGNRKEIALATEYLVNGFKKHSFYEKYQTILLKHCLHLLDNGLLETWRAEGEDKVSSVKKAYISVLQSCFKKFKNISICHIGSSNLMYIIRTLPYLQDINLSFQFSSLISIMNKSNYVEDGYNHKNIFRKKMIEKDILSGFWERINSEKIDYLILDFIEERHDIICMENGFITLSDALVQTEADYKQNKIIQSGTDEWFSLWKENCICFFDEIQNYMDLNHIILVKNYLVEEYGDVFRRKAYENIKEIRRQNKTIHKCYSFVEENYPVIELIESSDAEHYFTDKKYDYGVYPWHLNVIVNEKIGEMIERCIDTK